MTNTTRHRVREALAATFGITLGVIATLLWQALPLITPRSEAAHRLDLGMRVRGDGTNFTQTQGGEVVGRVTADHFASDDTCTWLAGDVRVTKEQHGAGTEAAISAREAVHHGPAEATVFAGDVSFVAPERGAGSADVLVTTVDGSFAARAQPAVVAHGGFELAGGLITYDAATGAVRVRRDAHADFDVPDHPLGADCDAFVEADEARVEDGGGWWFSGGARAWCGSSLLTSEVIHGDRETVRATGDVRLSLRTPTGSDVEVQAGSLERASRAEAVFSGGVTATGPDGHLSCDALRVGLRDGEITSLRCEGSDVEVTAAPGRVTGATLYLHDLESGKVTVRGRPATVERSDGSAMSAAVFEHDLVTGRVQARSRS